MTRFTKKLLSVLLAAVLLLSAGVIALAADAPFDDDAYVSILTGSDFQDVGTKAYDRFGRMLAKMQADGLTTPDSMLVGGDYTKVLFDYAAPGITQIGMNLKAVFPDADENAVVCIQGNHDNVTAGFAKTGFTDMGAYNLYVINEDDFPWQQGSQPWVKTKIQKLAADLEGRLNGLIEAGDTRPVLVVTHLPLHHTSRNNYADNKYASYLFNVLNEAGKTLDVIFLFGHQHSGDYDDYIGGSVNFMGAGETIRVPLPDRQGADAYTEETLNFTYTNCGYVGYSNNSLTETSTNVLTLSVIRIGERNIRFVKYTEDGLYKTWDVARVAPGNAAVQTERRSLPTLVNAVMWKIERSFFTFFYSLLKQLRGVFVR